jgi:hypothetical protein
VAATGEYTAFHGGTVGGALAAISTTINRVNGIYERELSIRMTLVGNNNQIIFTNAGTDSYTNNDGSMMLGQNQTTLDTIIGPANYDIGHVFSTGGGGIATLEGPCNDGFKARGVTGSSNPVGDPFDVDFVAHEIGHQFGAGHTFNANGQLNCSGNRDNTSAYEPAGGTTIMAYAGICGSQNIQPNSNDHFHAISFDEIMAFVTDTSPGGGGVCAQTAATGNTAPTVEAGPSYTIPKQTPFTLTGSANDPGDSLTYHWEQFNLGPAWTDFSAGGLPNVDSPGMAVPIFRSYSPTPNNSRTFPALANVLDGTYKNKGESLPNIGRTLTFRLTARDNKGGVASDAMNVVVNSAAGPFRVTAPTGTVVWSPGATQNVTWNPANTTGAPVNCPNVNILLSVNGGSSFTTLLAGTPNDGSQNIAVPASFSSNAYIKVQCANNIFFDVSKANLTICTPLLNETHEAATSNWTPSQSSGSNPWTRPSNGANAYSGSRYWFVENFDGDSDSNLDSPTLTASNNSLLLRFFHKYNLEPNGSSDAFDGGLLEIKVGSGSWSYIEKSKFTKNGYNRTMSGSPTPINGKQVFSGNSGGYIESIVDLSSLVSQGQNFQIRFRQVNDFTTGVDGWYVDDVFICGGDAAAPPGAQPTTHLPIIIKQ